MTTWTTSEMEILNVLTRGLRGLELTQLGDIWWPDHTTKRALRRELEHLCDAALLHRAIVVAHPRLAIESPLIAWSPGDGEPDFEATRRAIIDRWREPECLIEVYWASAKAANLFGSSGGRPPNAAHRNHDLLLSEVYVHYRRKCADLVSHWIGENCLPKAGYRIKDPDAFLIDGDGEPYRVIESAGRYNIKQLQSFHDHCAEQCISYELW